MEGLEISEVSLSELEEGVRIDSEMYQRHFLTFYDFIRRNRVTSFANECTVVRKGIFDIKSEVYADTGVPFVRISNLKSMIVNTDDIIYIPESENDKNLETFLKRDDIILSKTAYPAASIVNLDFCNTSQDTVAIKLRKDSELLSHFVVVYLNTRYGLDSIRRWFTGNIQMHLNLDDCRHNVALPVFSQSFQEIIKNIFVKSIQTQQRGKALYQEAEALLLAELGLGDWQPTTKTTEVKSFADSFGSSGRLDAEYYQPRFDELESKLRATGKAVCLGSLLTFCQRGTQPAYVDDAGLGVINSKHVRANRIDFSDNRVAVESQTRSDLVIRKGDVLINGTGVGTIGRSAAYLLDTKALPDNHVTILRSKSIDPVFLALQLNSIIGRLQVDKYFKGSSGQIELYPDDINQFLIWQAPDDVQVSIRDRIEMGQELSAQSAQLLSTAKRAVELAIETSEEKAVAWLNEQAM